MEKPNLESRERSRFLGFIAKESERLTRLINQVLDVSKIESGREEWRALPVDLREVVSDAVTAMSQVFEDQKISVRIGDTPTQSVMALGDVDRVIQVILNLLSNAAKFSPQGHGEIQIEFAFLAEHVRIDVRDNGPGIHKRDQEFIFDRFRRVKDSDAGKSQGTGLGLYISRTIVERFGGQLWVESAPGQGACFSFTLPKA